MNNYDIFCSPGKKIAVLIDPDKPSDAEVLAFAEEDER